MNGHLLAVFIFATILASSAEPHLIGTWPPNPIQTGNPEAIRTIGDRAFLSLGTSGVRVVDLSNPAQPQTIAALDTPGLAVQSAGRGNIVVVADREAGFLVADITDPDRARIGRCLTTSSIYGVDIYGNYAVAAGFQEIFIIDIRDVENPVPVGSLALSGLADDVRIAGTKVYASISRYGLPMMLAIIDISDPAMPKKLSEIENSSSAALTSPSSSLKPDTAYIPAPYWVAFEVVGAVAYLLDPFSLSTWNVSDPAKPVFLAKLPSAYTEISVSGDYAFLCKRSPGALTIANVADPTAPKIVTDFAPTAASQFRKVAAFGHYVLTFASNAGLRIYNVADPLNISQAGFLDISPGITKAVGRNNLAYAAGSSDFYIFDLTNPAKPVPLSLYHLPSPSLDMVLKDNTAIVALSDGLFFLDISNPSRPALLKYITSFPHPENPEAFIDPRAVAVSGNTLYVAGGGAFSQAFFLFDISDVSNPRYLASFPWRVADSVAATGNFAYVIGWDDKSPPENILRIVDATDPLHPVLKSTTAIVSPPTAVAADGGYAYLTTQDGLVIMDVTDPAVPIRIGNLPIRPSPDEITISGQRAYLVGYTTLNEVDISAPEQPVLLSSSSTLSGSSISIANPLAFISSRYYPNYLKIANLGAPARPILTSSISPTGLRNLRLNGEADRSYQIDFATSLSAGAAWTPLPTITPTNTTHLLTAPSAEPKIFYRARVAP